MKTDNYTKFVLTIIAACLLFLSAKELKIISTANADSVNLKTGYGVVPLNEDGSINVRLQSSGVVDVRLRGIDEATNLSWEAIKVKVVQ